MSHWTWVVASLVGIVGTARLVRLVTYDSYPPAAWLRAKWAGLMDEDGDSKRSQWAVLLTCPFCLSPYLTAANIAWAYFSDLHWSWWLFNGWLAASYLASIVVAYDQPEES